VKSVIKCFYISEHRNGNFSHPMDNDKLRDAKLTEEMADSILAAEEILALKLRFHEQPDQTYTFECKGKTVTTTYETATLIGQTQPHLTGGVKGLANLYRIKLIAPPGKAINGPCYITDRHGRKQKGQATTESGKKQNRIVIETLAVKL
jgi:hypothetical protein